MPIRPTSGSHGRVSRRTASALAFALLAGAVAMMSSPPATAAGGGTVDLSGAVPATFTIRPGVQVVTVTGAGAGDHLTLLAPGTSERLLTLVADSLGQANFAYVPDSYLTFVTGAGNPLPTTAGHTLKPGMYRIADESRSPLEVTDLFGVEAVGDHPPASFYDSHTVNLGYQYLEVRDGVQLSINVRFPASGLYGNGPYPTVVEYSGYGPSNPDHEEPGTRIADLLGFASVAVNMRGSGCSGGVFDVFNPAQFADGYDVIESIARQPWVLNHKVGMVGLSYSGISQLFVASTRPPSLAAITPLSVIEDPWFEQWPGGVYNGGFTKQWLAERDAQNAPGGDSWVSKRINNGDTTCADNVKLRSQNPDFEKFAKALEFRPADADERRLARLVPNIDVPVYLTGAWQDEETGAKFASMLGDFDNAPVKKFTVFNGRHPDGYTPMVLWRWYEFLSFYVKREVPHIPDLVRFFAPAVFETEFGAPGLGFENERFSPPFSSALAAYEAEPSVRVLFENGAGHPTVPAAPVQRGEASYPSWPPPSATPRTWYLGDDGSLTDTAWAGHAADRFQFDAGAGPVSYSSSSAMDFVKPPINVNWQPLAQGMGLSYLTEPLSSDMTVAGPGHLDIWLRSTATDANLEVVMSEVYPDGNEVQVQTGQLRAGFRAVDASRTDQFLVEHLYDQAHYQQLPAGQFSQVQIPLYAVAHPFRAGSRLRITIGTPGRDLPLWAFENPSYGTDPVYDDVARGGTMASKLVLPVVPTVILPTDHPPCDSLRGQVCRTGGYVEITNTEIERVEPPTTTTTTTAGPTGSTGSTGSTGGSTASTAASSAASRAVVDQAAPRFTG